MHSSAIARPQGFRLDWRRISAISSTLSLHLLVLLIMLIPWAAQEMHTREKYNDPVTVDIITAQPEPILPIPPSPAPPQRTIKRHTVTPANTPSTATTIPIVTPTSSNDEDEQTPESTSPSNSIQSSAPSALSYAGATPVHYPMESKRHHEQGVVIVRVLVSENGTPLKVELEKSSGYLRLDRAAQESVMNWRFQPGTRDGQVHEAWGRIPIAFHLEEN